MKKLSSELDKNLSIVKELLPAEDVLVHNFVSKNDLRFAVVYSDGLIDKKSLAENVILPLTDIDFNIDDTGENLQKAILFPEVKVLEDFVEAQKEILEGNVVLFANGVPLIFAVGTKLPPSRAVSEPPNDVTIKGPREGFVEDVKTNMALVRKRLKTPDLRFENITMGKRSNTNIAVCYLKGIANDDTVYEIKSKLEKTETDIIPDSSYVATFISDRRHSVFKSVGTTEKPDIFADKLAEGRVGILVDGSPTALTTPYMLVEEFQSPDDYFVSPVMATITRFLRFFAFLISILLPAYYVSSQLFKLQLLPLGLTLTIASSIQGLPLSPSLEMFLVLTVLEVIKEASVRMPKYVSMALSIVGALVLGETAVSAGFVSTPAIIIVAFSGICMYTVPNFVETGSIIRWCFLILAGSVGPFGIVLFTAFLLYYAISSDSFGTPLLAPFSPLIAHDLRDSIVKYGVENLKTRPKVFKPKNKTRLKIKEKNDAKNDR